MAHARLLQKKTSHDRRVAQLSDRAALLFVLSIPHLDVEGRILGLPAHVRGTVVPEFAHARAADWTDELVGSYMLEWTSTLDDLGQPDPLVLWYATEGVSVCAFRGFQKNQKLRRDREAPSRLPAPPPELLAQPALAHAGMTGSHASPRSGSPPSPKEKDQVQDSSAGLSVASARARDQLPEGLQVAQIVEDALSASAQPVSNGGLAQTPAGDIRFPLDDLDVLAETLRGGDAGTAHLLRVWQRRGCGEREFAMAQESLVRRRAMSGRRPLESEARYVCSELARLLGEREAAA